MLYLVISSNLDVVIAPTAAHLVYVKERINSKIQVSAQNSYKVGDTMQMFVCKFSIFGKNGSEF